MLCTSCDQENPEGSAFCEHCGAKLQPTCPSCGSEVGITARFCRTCGTTLATSDNSSPATIPSPSHTSAGTEESATLPTSFSGGRYAVSKFLG